MGSPWKSRGCREQCGSSADGGTSGLEQRMPMPRFVQELRISRQSCTHPRSCAGCVSTCPHPLHRRLIWCVLHVKIREESVVDVFIKEKQILLEKLSESGLLA